MNRKNDFVMDEMIEKNLSYNVNHLLVDDNTKEKLVRWGIRDDDTVVVLDFV